ncbi:MAG: hypothetical protein RJA49_334 [Actinomycetota bacterium]
MTSYAPMTAAHDPGGHLVRWATWDGEHLDTTTIRYENEGFTVSGVLTRERVEFVVRLSSTWQVRQFILFRDLEEPDLWLATDGSGRWGEMNGAHRTELDGCYDVLLEGSAFTNALPIHRLPLLEGHAAEVPVVRVDPETLAVEAVTHRYTRLASHRWRIETEAAGSAIEVEVDEHGVVLDYPDGFRRLS